MAAGARATPTRTPPRPSSPAPRTEAVVPPDWDSAVTLVSSHTTPPVVVVCGPKNSGKSTFSRTLLNALLPRQATTELNPNAPPDDYFSDAGASLTSGVVALRRHRKVAYLDTDVGQPEFALPGCISFHIVDEALEG